MVSKKTPKAYFTVPALPFKNVHWNVVGLE